MVPSGLFVVQLIKANVSATDSTVGLTLTWAGLEPSRAHAVGGCKNNMPMAITQIAIMRRDPFTLVICRSPMPCCPERGSFIEHTERKAGRTNRSAPLVVANHITA